MNRKDLIIAVAIGAVLQLAMVVSGHWVEAIRGQYMALGLGIAFVAGLILGLRTRSGWRGTLLGGLAAGGVGAFVGVTLSFILGDVPAPVIIFATVSSALSGLIGAALARLVRRPEGATAQP